MKSLKKIILILSVIPLLTTTALIAHGGAHEERPAMHRDMNHSNMNHPNYHPDVNKAAFNRGMEAGTVEGAGAAGGYAQPAYPYPPQTQYVPVQTPVTTPTTTGK